MKNGNIQLSSLFKVQVYVDTEPLLVYGFQGIVGYLRFPLEWLQDGLQFSDMALALDARAVPTYVMIHVVFSNINL